MDANRILLTFLLESPYQIVLGLDVTRRSYRGHYGRAPGITVLLTEFWDTLQTARVTDEALRRSSCGPPPSPSPE